MPGHLKAGSPGQGIPRLGIPGHLKAGSPDTGAGYTGALEGWVTGAGYTGALDTWKT